MSSYTDTDYCAFVDACRDATGNVPREATVTAILDAFVPAIAARALREASTDMWSKGGPSTVSYVYDWLQARADEIEANL